MQSPAYVLPPSPCHLGINYSVRLPDIETPMYRAIIEFLRIRSCNFYTPMSDDICTLYIRSDNGHLHVTCTLKNASVILVMCNSRAFWSGTFSEVMYLNHWTMEESDCNMRSVYSKLRGHKRCGAHTHAMHQDVCLKASIMISKQHWFRLPTEITQLYGPVFGQRSRGWILSLNANNAKSISMP